jgi:hypothetical protein
VLPGGGGPGRLKPDQRVDGHDAFRIGDEGIDVDFKDVRPFRKEAGKSRDSPGPGGKIESACAR